MSEELQAVIACAVAVVRADDMAGGHYDEMMTTLELLKEAVVKAGLL